MLLLQNLKKLKPLLSPVSACQNHIFWNQILCYSRTPGKRRIEVIALLDLLCADCWIGDSQAEAHLRRVWCGLHASACTRCLFLMLCLWHIYRKVYIWDFICIIPRAVAHMDHIFNVDLLVLIRSNKNRAIFNCTQSDHIQSCQKQR